MNSRFEFALSQLKGSDWERFERIASVFLVEEFPTLRTMACPSGDGGRDAELFSPDNGASVVLQYSVQEDWRAKVQTTAKRVSENLPNARLIIYVTNQVLGARGDDLKKQIFGDYKLFVDFRDRTFFLDRVDRSSATQIAAEKLAQELVDPITLPIGSGTRTSQHLTTQEARAAHVYLSLQMQDDVQDKGLTKLTFEALVRSAMTNTSPDQLMSRTEICARVRSLVPNHSKEHIDALTNSAIRRLDKKVIRAYPNNTFCLNHDEVVRAEEFAATREVEEAELKEEITTVVRMVTEKTQSPGFTITSMAARVRRVIDDCLLERAEAFAHVVISGKLEQFASEHLRAATQKDIALNSPPKGSPEGNVDLIMNLVTETLSSRSEHISAHLRNLSDAYTLMAFLRQTPDIQAAVQKIFAHGEIWVDTSILLPLIAEELFPTEQARTFQQIFSICVDAGLSFYVTSGVIEELEAHIKNSLACSQSSSLWNGQAPFLLQAYLQVGRPIGQFSGWLEELRGYQQPTKDLEEYLQETFRIELQDFQNELQLVPNEVRFALDTLWSESQRRKRERRNIAIDSLNIDRLSKHDSESYLGVVWRRKKEKNSTLGYSAWWLTFDHVALRAADYLAKNTSFPAPDSPVLSIDFLAQYVSLGPIRAKVPKSRVQTVPVVIEPSLVRFLTTDLMSKAEEIRNEMVGIPERIIRRHVRDFLNSERRKLGPMAKRGIETFYEELS